MGVKVPDLTSTGAGIQVRADEQGEFLPEGRKMLPGIVGLEHFPADSRHGGLQHFGDQLWIFRERLSSTRQHAGDRSIGSLSNLACDPRSVDVRTHRIESD